MRTAYLLTTNTNSERCICSKKILEQIGFIVKIFIALPDKDPVISNKISMCSIYQTIQNGPDEYGYVFEDDIKLLDKITLDEIIEYEAISPVFFYLGICDYNYGEPIVKKTEYIIRNHPVYSKSGHVRGLHAIGISKFGVQLLLQFLETYHHKYMDMVFEEFTLLYPANVVRFDLKSPCEPDHYGILYQNRKNFKSEIF